MAISATEPRSFTTAGGQDVTRAHTASGLAANTWRARVHKLFSDDPGGHQRIQRSSAEHAVAVHLYSTSSSRAPAYLAIAVVAFVVGIAAEAVSTTLGLSLSWLVRASIVAGAYVLLYGLVDTRAWRWTVLRKVGLIDTPMIAGVYEGTLLSSWDNATEVPIRLTVSQRWTRLLVQIERTDKAAPRWVSVTAALAVRSNTDAHLTFTYKDGVRHGVGDADMPDHDGVADLDIGLSGGSVAGTYFNAQPHRGTITLRRA